MAKVTLSDIVPGYSAPARINANNDAIEAGFENTLSRNGTAPNAMLANIDMDSNRVINLGAPTAATDAARWVDVTEAVEVTGALVPALTGNAGKTLTTDGSILIFDDVDPYFEITAAEQAALVTPVSYKYPPGNVLRYGTNTSPGGTDMTAAIQAAHDQGNQTTGIRPYLPSGSYLITSTIEPCVLGMYGDGAKMSRIICENTDAFTVPSNAGWDRPQVVFEKFGIDSDDGMSCDAKFAFYFPGVAPAAAAVYNSGFTVRDVQIGRHNRMGGAFNLKDVFDACIENVICTNVSRLVYLQGSVVQSNFHRVRSFNDAAGTGMSRHGIETATAVYADGVRTPESVAFTKCSYIRGTQGIVHGAGLGQTVTFEEFDCEVTQRGALLNNPCKAKGGIWAPAAGATAWIGVTVGVNTAGAEDMISLEDVEINTLNLPTDVANSFAIDLGDGISPVHNVSIRNCVIQGVASSLLTAIRARIVNRLKIDGVAIESGVLTSTGISMTSCERVSVTNCAIPGASITVSDGGSATAYGEVRLNECSSISLSLTTPSNWSIGPNEATSTIFPATMVGTFTASLNGCTTIPTGTCRWERNGRSVTLFIPAIEATSNATSANFTGMPVDIRPARIQDLIGRAKDNGSNGICGYRINTNGTVEMFFGATLSVFTNTGTKGTANCTLHYSLD